MKYRRLYVIGMLVLLMIACTREPSKEKDVLATVNDFKMTLGEFQRLLASDMKNDPELKMTDQVKSSYLNDIIQKEILIQEAKRLKLDQREKFIQTIERYWESTLIRDLIEKKGQELAQRAVVTQEEIQQRYNEMKAKDPKIAPLPDMATTIAGRLKEQKKTQMFQQWVEALKQKAKIHIDQKLLGQF
jgi:uncharacterized protein YdiU (UPF0061 family)